MSLQASWFFKKLANRDAIFFNCIVVVMQLYNMIYQLLPRFKSLLGFADG